MSKTFKSDNELANTISITRSQGRVLVEIEDPKHLIAINLSDNNAPALALAILEAAGYVEVPDGDTSAEVQFGRAINRLRRGIEEQERITAEARERAELEAEALELYNACMGHNLTSWADLWGGKLRDQWLAVARRAREINKENPNA